MRTVLHVIRKEFTQIRRDRRMIFLILVAPLFQLIILGYAANLDVRNLATLICDRDNSPRSRELVSRFTAIGVFAVRNRTPDPAAIDAEIDQGRVSMALVIPAGFGADLAAGRTAPLQLVVDGSETNSATLGLSHAAAIVAAYSRDILLERVTRVAGVSAALSGGVMVAPRVWYNPDLKSRNFMLPGVLALILMIVTATLTSLSIVKEREQGTMEQLVVSPLRPWQIILGKLAPFTVLALISITLALLPVLFWFRIPLRGSFVLLVFMSLGYLMCMLGLGLLLSTISRTQQQAMMTSQFFVMIPMMYLSGFAFPIENMPGLIRLVTYLMPLRYFLTILRGIFLKGTGLAQLWPDAAALFGLGLAILAVSIARFRRRLE
jgi:ABC-2 type transport system permease protein